MRVLQGADGISPGRLALLGVAVIVIVGLSVAFAWWLVSPPPASTHRPGPSILQHELFDEPPPAAPFLATAAVRLQGYAWVDRAAGVARIPIGVAIDAVVANPSLIAPRETP